MKYLALLLLRVYKLTLSPIFHVLGVRCRYEPGCSSYSMEAISRHGFWKGGWMTAARLSRCHPITVLGGSSGIDNVPKTAKHAPFWAPWRYGVWRHNPDQDLRERDDEHDHTDLS